MSDVVSDAMGDVVGDAVGSVDPKAGFVAFVGGGPGDPRLVSLRGAALLSAATLVAHGEELPHALLELVPSSTARLVVGDGRPLSEPRAIAAELASHARNGGRVVRLVAGDPLLFRGLDEEIELVAAAGARFEVVPGVPEGIALGAFAGIATTRGHDPSPSVAFARAIGEDEVHLHDWAKLASSTDLLVVSTDVRSLAELHHLVMSNGRGRKTPALVATNIGTPRQSVTCGALEEIVRLARPLGDGTRVLFAVGDPVSRSDARRWFDRRPLFGKRVLVTRAKEQAGATATRLAEAGAEAIVMPTIRIEPPSDPAPLAQAVAALGRSRAAAFVRPGPSAPAQVDSAQAVPAGSAYAWVAFTSANGVHATLREVARQGGDARYFGGCGIAAIGPGTARALEAYGLRADVVAKEFRGEGLAAELLGAIDASGVPREAVRVLIPRAKQAREVLPDTLREAGCSVDVVPAYETHGALPDAAEGLASALERREIDAIAFTSSSTVEHLVELLERVRPGRVAALLADVVLASIGPITSDTLVRRGLRADVTADVYTVEGLVRALEAHAARGERGGA
jgi:uroporphyrinogen III methyltransferase/synthase